MRGGAGAGVSLAGGFFGASWQLVSAVRRERSKNHRFIGRAKQMHGAE